MKRLTRRAKESFSRRPVLSRTLHDVHFAVACPEVLIRSSSAVIDVVAFTEANRDRIMRLVREERLERVDVTTQGPTPIATGVTILVRLRIDGVQIPEPEAQLLWTGELSKAAFVVDVASDANRGDKTGFVNFYIGGIPVAKIPFVVRIAQRPSEGSRPPTVTEQPNSPKTAFASYATRNRREVLTRVQGIEKAGIDVFLDVKSLRSGENYERKLMHMIETRDVFYLFWSRAARASKWVEREWRCALNAKGPEYIDPVPLESPETAPPPAELASTLHFNDWVLAYTTSRSFAPKRWWEFWR